MTPNTTLPEATQHEAQLFKSLYSKSNGKERMGRATNHDSNTMPTLLGKVPHFFKNKIAAAATYLLNRIPKVITNMDMPRHRIFEKHASLSHLRILCVRAVVHQQLHTGNLADKCWERKLVGNNSNSSTYRTYNPSSRNAIPSRNRTSIECPKPIGDYLPDQKSSFPMTSSRQTWRTLRSTMEESEV